MFMCSIQFSPGTAWCCITRGRLKDVPTALPAPCSCGHRQTCERCLPQLFICTLGRPYLLLLIYYLSETHRKPQNQQYMPCSAWILKEEKGKKSGNHQWKVIVLSYSSCEYGESRPCQPSPTCLVPAHRSTAGTVSTYTAV